MKHCLTVLIYERRSEISPYTLHEGTQGESTYVYSCMKPYDIHSTNVVSGILYVIPKNMRLAPLVILDLKI